MSCPLPLQPVHHVCSPSRLYIMPAVPHGSDCCCAQHRVAPCNMLSLFCAEPDPKLQTEGVTGSHPNLLLLPLHSCLPLSLPWLLTHARSRQRHQPKLEAVGALLQQLAPQAQNPGLHTGLAHDAVLEVVVRHGQ